MNFETVPDCEVLFKHKNPFKNHSQLCIDVGIYRYVFDCLNRKWSIVGKATVKNNGFKM